MLLQSARDIDLGQHSFQQPASLSFLCPFLVTGERNFPSSIHLGPEPEKNLFPSAQCPIVHLCPITHKLLWHPRASTEVILKWS